MPFEKERYYGSNTPPIWTDAEGYQFCRAHRRDDCPWCGQSHKKHNFRKKHFDEEGEHLADEDLTDIITKESENEVHPCEATKRVWVEVGLGKEGEEPDWGREETAVIYDFLYPEENRRCFHYKCRKPDAEFMCSNCRKVYFCGRSCQKAAWVQHKHLCFIDEHRSLKAKLKRLNPLDFRIMNRDKEEKKEKEKEKEKEKGGGSDSESSDDGDILIERSMEEMMSGGML
jgi:hypothetical protein